MFFYRVPPPPPVLSVEDDFEYVDGWPGTLNTNPQFLTPIIDENFETVDGWPGT